MRKYLPLFLVFCAVLLVYQQAFAQTVSNIRFGKQGDMTRIVMDLDKRAAFHFDTLNSPPRLVVDFSDNVTFLRKSTKDFTGRVKSIRYGDFDKDTNRIVFDLNKPALVKKYFHIPASSKNSAHRIVIDFLDDPNPGTTSKQPELKTPKIINIEPNVLVEQRADRNLPTPKPKFLTKSYQKTYLIVIDPGHGGGDPGAIGHNGIQEKHVVLSLAQKIKTKLESTKRFKVYLTRNTDHYIKLRERFRRARDVGGNLFISLHADKNPVKSVRGASVYTLSETASDKETARLARQENNAGVVAGVDLAIEEDTVANILLDLVRRETLNESKLFAEILVEKMRDKRIRRLNNTHRYAGFAVLKAPDIPSVLIEAGFMSNPDDAKLLQTKQYQEDMAEAIEQSIHAFFDRIERLEKQ